MKPTGECATYCPTCKFETLCRRGIGTLSGQWICERCNNPITPDTEAIQPIGFEAGLLEAWVIHRASTKGQTPHTPEQMAFAKATGWNGGCNNFYSGFAAGVKWQAFRPAPTIDELQQRVLELERLLLEAASHVHGNIRRTWIEQERAALVPPESITDNDPFLIEIRAALAKVPA